MGVSTTN